jgi:hypothetical protein
MRKKEAAEEEEKEWGEEKDCNKKILLFTSSPFLHSCIMQKPHLTSS